MESDRVYHAFVSARVETPNGELGCADLDGQVCTYREKG
jgi:hypothetical protein